MDVLCNLRPKPSLPFAGKLRVIDFSLSNCIHSQVRSIGVLVDYQRSYMADYLGEWAVEKAGLASIFALQPESGSYTRTSDAGYQNLAYLDRQLGNSVLVLAGDHVYRMDYCKMVAFHEKMAADAVVGVMRVPIAEAHRFGTVVVNDEGRIQEFVEKSSRPLSTMASMGIYVFNKDILANRLVEDALITDSPHDFGYAVLPGMVKHDRVFAYELNGCWQDIGTVEAYCQANMELLIACPRFSIDGKGPVCRDKSALPMPEGSKDGKVVNSLISPGCIIRGRVEYSVLSPGVHFEEHAIVRNSVVIANTVVGYHSVVDSCIIDDGVQAGRSSYIGLGSHPVPGDCAITLVGKDVVVPPHIAIGCRCKVQPNVGPVDFRASLVPSGTVVLSSSLT
ncbi:MAG: sugar phosphate nucleotidyltransferase [Dehalococcoidia bacterium]